MRKAHGNLKFWLFLGGLMLSPVLAYGQDLGSSTGLFRAPLSTNKKASPAAEKKATPKASTAKKTTPKPAAPKSAVRNNSAKTTSRPKSEVAKTAPLKTPATNNQSNNRPVQENIVIEVGKPNTNVSSNTGTSNAIATTHTADDLFDQAIEEGNTARDNRNYAAAEKAYRQAQDMKPKDSRAIYGLGNLYSDQQRWEEAEKAYRQATALDADSPEAHIALSFVLTQPITGATLSERYTEAQTAARRAIQLDPNNPVGYDQLGTALELSGQIGNETQNMYRKAIQLEPTFALAYAHLGRLLRRTGKTQESAAAYSDAIRLSTDVPTMILVAEVMQSQQRFAESEQLLNRAVAGDPKNPTALFLLGRALTTRGAFDEAEKLLKRSVEVSPNNFVSYALLGSLYARRGIYDEAEKILMQAVRVISPNEKKRLAQEFEFVGDGLMRAGKSRDAARVYRQAVLLDNEKSDLSVKLSKAEKS